MISLMDLPPEVLFEIFDLVPLELSRTNRFFYIMLNHYFHDRLIRDCGSNVLLWLSLHDFYAFIDYIKSLDYWRKTQRMIIARYCNLRPYQEVLLGKQHPEQLNKCEFIGDSWQFIYQIYKSRRIYFDKESCQFDESRSSFDHGLLKINRTYLLKFKKQVRLPAGKYRFIGTVVLENPAGLSSVNFKIVNKSSGEILCDYFPPSSIKSLVPGAKLCVLNMGDFALGRKNGTLKEIDDFTDLDVLVEDSEFMKAGFTLCYLDILPIGRNVHRPPTWVFWTIDNQTPTPENVTNVLLKRLYDSIEHSVSGKLDLDPAPYQPLGSYSNGHEHFVCPKLATSPEEHKERNASVGIDISTYSKDFYTKFNKKGELITRTFKFFTVIDKRKYDKVLSRRRETMERSSKEHQNEPLRWKFAHYLAV